MKRRNYLKTTAGIATASTIGLAGCAGKSTGTLAARVSDQPGDISDFETCVVHITAVWVKPADGDLVKKDVEDTSADLVKLQGEKSALVDEVELAAGEYEFVQLKVSKVEATLKDGGDATVKTPGEAPLKFEKFVHQGEQTQTFEIREGTTTTFTADFTPVKQGKTNRYVLQPVASETTVYYEGESTPTPTSA